MMYFAHKHHRKHSFITLSILGVILLFVGGIVFLIVTEKLPPQEEQLFPQKNAVTPSSYQQATITGQIVCLPHKNPGEMQTLECAFGLIDPQGMYYSLRDGDPEYKNISSAPMQVPVEVKGKYTPGENNLYQSVGVIDVESITQL